MEKYKVYIFPDMEAAGLYSNNDLDGFREAIENEELEASVDVEEFETEAEKNAFLKGFSYGRNEDSTDFLILCSDNECDIPYIEILESTL